MVEEYLEQDEKLYSAFMDLDMAYELIGKLWNVKLLKGIK